MAGNQQQHNSNFLYLQQEIFYLSERLNSLISQQNNSSGVAAILLLAKATVSLNPTISCTYTDLSHTFASGNTVIDSNGSTGVIVTDNGTNEMTLTQIKMASGYQAFSGTLRVSGGGGAGAGAGVGMGGGGYGGYGGYGGGSPTATVVSFSWGDQPITLAGGSNFVDVNLIISALTGADAPPIAEDFEVWSGVGRTGTLYFSTNIGSGIDALQNLAGTTNYISVLSGDIQSVTSPKLYVPSVLYITLSTVEQIAETVQLVVNGTIQN